MSFFPYDGGQNIYSDNMSYRGGLQCNFPYGTHSVLEYNFPQITSLDQTFQSLKTLSLLKNFFFFQNVTRLRGESIIFYRHVIYSDNMSYRGGLQCKFPYGTHSVLEYNFPQITSLDQTIQSLKTRSLFKNFFRNVTRPRSKSIIFYRHIQV